MFYISQWREYQYKIVVKLSRINIAIYSENYNAYMFHPFVAERRTGSHPMFAMYGGIATITFYATVNLGIHPYVQKMPQLTPQIVSIRQIN
jgi:hypothetical protein